MYKSLLNYTNTFCVFCIISTIFSFRNRFFILSLISPCLHKAVAILLQKNTIVARLEQNTAIAK